MTPLLEVKHLTVRFPVRSGALRRITAYTHAVSDVSFSLAAGETLALVGESGSGKTTTGRAILRLTEPTSGEVRFRGVDVLQLKGEELRRMRRHMQIIFQDPYTSLNPRMTVGAAIREGLLVHDIARGGEADRRVVQLLDEVGLPASAASRFPHEFSGGQRQRIGIARALAVEPSFIVCDEPVSALDVSVQAQVINLLRDLQRERGLSYLFIAHDLAIVSHIADRVAVMYMGRIVETAPTAVLFAGPRMPYTKVLLSAIPVPDPATRRVRLLTPGEPPSATDPPPGCAFYSRCTHPLRDEACTRTVPPLELKAADHYAACIKEPPMREPPTKEPPMAVTARKK